MSYPVCCLCWHIVTPHGQNYDDEDEDEDDEDDEEDDEREVRPQRHQSKVSFDCEDSFPTQALMISIGWIGSVKLLTRNPDLGKYWRLDFFLPNLQDFWRIPTSISCKASDVVHRKADMINGIWWTRIVHVAKKHPEDDAWLKFWGKEGANESLFKFFSELTISMLSCPILKIPFIQVRFPNPLHVVTFKSVGESDWCVCFPF